MPLSDLTLQSRSKNTPPDLQQPQFTVNDRVRTGTMIHMARYFETHANLPGHISVWDYWYHEPPTPSTRHDAREAHAHIPFPQSTPSVSGCLKRYKHPRLSRDYSPPRPPQRARLRHVPGWLIGMSRSMYTSIVPFPELEADC